jgi:hypothetical protein
MPIRIEIKTRGLEEAQKAVSTLAEMIENPDAKLATRMGDAVLEDIDERYMTRGYGQWPPLSPETIKRKGHDNPLIDTGAMFASSRYKLLGPGRVMVEMPFGGRGHDARVPSFHQNGTSRTPQRQIIAITPQLINRIQATVEQWIDDMLKAFKVKL